jgi:hypothetical protein
MPQRSAIAIGKAAMAQPLMPAVWQKGERKTQLLGDFLGDLLVATL